MLIEKHVSFTLNFYSMLMVNFFKGNKIAFIFRLIIKGQLLYFIHLELVYIIDYRETCFTWNCTKVSMSVFHLKFFQNLCAFVPSGHTGRLLKSLCFTSLSFLILHIIFHITLASLEAQHHITPGYNCEY